MTIRKSIISERGISMIWTKNRHHLIHLILCVTIVFFLLCSASVTAQVVSDSPFFFLSRHKSGECTVITPAGTNAEMRVHQENIFSESYGGSFSADRLCFDGSDWSNSGGNAQRNGLSTSQGPQSSDLLWSGGRSSIISWLPVTEGNRVYVVRQAGWPGSANDSVVVAMDLLSGQELWCIEIPYHTDDWTTWVAGVNQGIVYASRSGNGASVLDNLYALDAMTGETQWVSSVLIDAGPYDGVVFASDGDPVIASFTDIWRLNAQDGELVWHASRVGSVSGSCGGVLFGESLYVADAAPGGHILVRYDLNTGQRLYQSPVMSGFTLQNTPFVGPDGTVYLSRTQNNPSVDFFYAFEDTGTAFEEKWHLPCAWTTFSEFAADDDGSVYCLLPGPRIGQIDSSTGEILSQSELVGTPGEYLSPHFAVDSWGIVFFSNGGFANGKVSVFTPSLEPLWNVSVVNINIGGPSVGRNGVLVLCGTGTTMRAYQTASPAFELNITTVSPKISASIQNSGQKNATNLIWNIRVTGGVLSRINLSESGTMPSLGTMEQVDITLSRRVFGFGRIRIEVMVTCDEGVSAYKTMDGFVLLFFILPMS